PAALAALAAAALAALAVARIAARRLGGHTGDSLGAAAAAGETAALVAFAALPPGSLGPSLAGLAA
ncbi:MAG: adenosylcobinamide-GDP ribazoletransferase, partial [Pseudomonadota bacterium]